MTRSTPVPDELRARLDQAGREISAATVAFHTAVAARRGLSPSDTKALDTLMREGPLTHAELVKRTALKPASVTDLIDRLEQRGLVERSRHPDDGRRVVVTARDDVIYASMAPLFGDWVGELTAIYDRYTDAELEVIADCMARMAIAQQGAAERLAASDD
ncbi:MAG: MarR family transcriptional regulator [Solirubrobacteraceae bacterium]|nr:MarR family transcriptional regulator [Solirubrobacteraceae bacterium]